jgi:hypothetical protein
LEVETMTRYCPNCGKSWETPPHVLELFHYCPSPGPMCLRRPTYHGTTREEARSQVFEAAVVALGGDSSIWRPLEEEESA